LIYTYLLGGLGTYEGF